MPQPKRYADLLHLYHVVVRQDGIVLAERDIPALDEDDAKTEPYSFGLDVWAGNPWEIEATRSDWT